MEDAEFNIGDVILYMLSNCKNIALLFKKDINPLFRNVGPDSSGNNVGFQFVPLLKFRILAIF